MCLFHGLGFITDKTNSVSESRQLTFKKGNPSNVIGDRLFSKALRTSVAALKSFSTELFVAETNRSLIYDDDPDESLRRLLQIFQSM